MPHQRPAYEEIEHYVNPIRKFFVDQHITQFVIRNAIDDPEEELTQIIDRLIERAYSHVSRKRQRETQLFSMLINGEGLDTPIVIPARKRQQNTAEMIMNEVIALVYIYEHFKMHLKFLRLTC